MIWNYDDHEDYKKPGILAQLFTRGLIILVSIWFFAQASTYYKTYSDAQTWKTTTCYIIKSNISSYEVKKSAKQWLSSLIHGSLRTYYHNDLAYRYKVNERDYLQGSFYGIYDEDHIYKGDSPSEKHHNLILNNYQAGKTYTCYYDPYDIHKAVLNRDMNTGDVYFVSILGIIVFVLAFLPYRWLRR